MLNPFSRAIRLEDSYIIGGFQGNSIINMGTLEKVAQITYYIGNDRLFKAGIFLVSNDVNLYAAGMGGLSFLFESERALVVLDERGWFGAFDVNALNLDCILN